MTIVFADSGLYALVDVAHDSNLFRLSGRVDAASVIGTSERSVTYTRTEVGLKSDVELWRQHFNLAANVNRTNFERFGFLNNLGGATSVVWDWVVGNQWQGNMGYSYVRSLANFEAQEGGQSARTESHGFVSANYRILPSWRVRAATEASRIGYGSIALQNLDSHSVSAELGLQYVAPSENSIGLR